MLLFANLSELFWQFARQTAVYIYNAIPGAHPEVQALSPDKRFYGRRQVLLPLLQPLTLREGQAALTRIGRRVTEVFCD